MHSDDIILFIENRRKELGLSQNDIASKIGYSSQLVFNWSKGKSLPDISVLYALGNILNLTIDEIFNCRVDESLTNKENKPFNSEDFSLNLKKHRVLESITQKDLANKMDVSYATIIAWEKGNSTPNINQFIKLSETFSIPFKDLYYGKFYNKQEKKNPKSHWKIIIASLCTLLVCGGVIGGVFAINNAKKNEENSNSETTSRIVSSSVEHTSVSEESSSSESNTSSELFSSSLSESSESSSDVSTSSKETESSSTSSQSSSMSDTSSSNDKSSDEKDSSTSSCYSSETQSCSSENTSSESTSSECSTTSSEESSSSSTSSNSTESSSGSTSSTVEKFTAKFFDEDLITLLWSKEYNVGESVIYEGLLPTKDGDVEYNYSFDKWVVTDASKIPSSSSDVGNVIYYVASYSSSENPTDPNEFSYGEFDIHTKTCSIIKYNGSRKNVTIPTIRNGYQVTFVDARVFEGNINIEKVTLPDEILKYGAYLFKDCANLKTIIFPKNIEKLPNNFFEGCLSLKEIVLPNSLTYIGSNCFDNCESLTNVTLPGTVKTLYQMFTSCTSLKTVVIPEGVTKLSATFYESNVEHVQLPNTLKTIDGRTFSNMPASIIELPDSVTTILGTAFDNQARFIIVPKTLEKWNFDDNLLPNYEPGCSCPEILFKGNKEDWNKIYFSMNIPNMDGEGNIHFYSESYSPNCWHYVDNIPTLY